MERGLYITFFESGEPFDRELPPVGPLDHVVVRHRQLVAERRSISQTPELGVDIARWLEAELEYQRATGEEPGGPKRTELRVAASDGVLLRFAVFGDRRERDVVAELGPFAVVVIGRHGVEADGQLLASRGTSELAAWDLTAAAGPDASGLRKPDIAFRTPATTYHPEIAMPVAPEAAPPPPIIIGAEEVAPQAPPVEAEPFAFRERERPTPEVYSAPTSFATPAEEPPALTQSDLELIRRIDQQRAEDTLRARILDEEKRRLGVDQADDAATTWAMRYRPQPEGAVLPAGPAPRGFEIGPALWRMRFAIIGVLLLLIGVYGFTVIRSGGAATVPGQGSLQYVNVAQHFSSPTWDYVANGVQRSPSAGTAQARGVYYVVRLGVTNKSTAGAQLSPSQFVLVDANGVEHGAESVASDAYQSTANQQSQFVWPQSFPAGKTITVPVIFDVDPSVARGNLLKISDLPNLRVRLD